MNGDCRRNRGGQSTQDQFRTTAFNEAATTYSIKSTYFRSISIDFNKLQVRPLTNTLRTNNAELLTEASKNLDRDHGILLQLIRYATDRAQERYAQLLTEFQFDYAGEDVAPTKMGNISRVAPHYAASRYSMNLDVFWTRLQKVVAADANFYSAMQDAKTLVDFLVAPIWYTFSFTVMWVIALPCMGEAHDLFLGIAIAGPLLTYAWYRLALQNYRAFANLLCFGRPVPHRSSEDAPNSAPG